MVYEHLIITISYIIAYVKVIKIFYNIIDLTVYSSREIYSAEYKANKPINEKYLVFFF